MDRCVAEAYLIMWGSWHRDVGINQGYGVGLIGRMIDKSGTPKNKITPLCDEDAEVVSSILHGCGGIVERVCLRRFAYRMNESQIARELSEINGKTFSQNRHAVRAALSCGIDAISKTFEREFVNRARPGDKFY